MPVRLLTFEDVLTHLQVFANAPAVGYLGAHMRTAVDLAAKRISGQRKDLNWYNRETIRTVHVPFQDGTVDYTAATRTVTLTGGTFPTKATEYTITLGDNRYPVFERVDGTTLRLYPGDSFPKPAADISGATTLLYHSRIQLPLDFAELSAVVDATTPTLPGRIPVSHATRIESFYPYLGNFNHFTVVPSIERPGQFDLWIPSSETHSRSLTIRYFSDPSEGVSSEVIRDGLVTIASGVATFSGGAPALRDEHAGWVLRVTGNTDPPAGKHGFIPEEGPPDVQNNPTTQELILLEKLTDTTANVNSLTTSVTNAQYSLSSWIDVRPGAAEAWLLRLAEQELGMLQTPHRDVSATSLRKLRQATMEAFSHDAQQPPGQPSGWGWGLIQGDRTVPV